MEPQNRSMESQKSNMKFISLEKTNMQHIDPRHGEVVSLDGHEKKVKPQREEEPRLKQSIKIIVALTSLTCLSDVFKEGDQLHHSLR